MLSRGASLTLAFLRARSGKTGQCWWKQQNIAAALRISLRTVGRHIAELTAAGELESLRRGSTSNLYTLRKTCGKHYTLEAENVRLDRPKCPNVSIELNLKPRRKLARPLFEIPPETIQSPEGRTAPNPEYVFLQGVVRSARSRIERAENPAAYSRAVMRAELEAFRAKQRPSNVVEKREVSLASYSSASGANEAQDVRVMPLPEPYLPVNPNETCASLAKEAGVGVEGHARQRRNGTGRCNPDVGLLDGRYLDIAAGNAESRSPGENLIAPIQAGIKSGTSAFSPQKKPPDSEHCDFSAAIADLARRKRIGGSP